MEVRINLNEPVKFKLSEYGKDIYRDWHNGSGPKLDDDGYMSMQLWSFMWIFGKHMIPGVHEVVRPLEIIYEQEEEKRTQTIRVEPNESFYNKIRWMHIKARILRRKVKEKG